MKFNGTLRFVDLGSGEWYLDKNGKTRRVFPEGAAIEQLAVYRESAAGPVEVEGHEVENMPVITTGGESEPTELGPIIATNITSA